LSADFQSKQLAPTASLFPRTMFIRAAFALALAALPLARAAYTVETPQAWYANISNVIHWNSLTTDPPLFSIELVHPKNIVNGALAIANNVDANLLELLIPLPRVPASGGYTILLINPGNISDVYARTGEFAIVDNPTDSDHPQGTAPTTTAASTAPPLPSQPSSVTLPSTTGNTTVVPPTTQAPPPASASSSVPIPTASTKPFSAAFTNSVSVGGLALVFAVALSL